MADAHIDDGDLAVIERGSEANVGDFVVAIVDGDYTLKELVLEQGRFALKPHNPSYPLIVPEAELEIFGVMVGLVRRFQS
jgi:repressor LexA